MTTDLDILHPDDAVYLRRALDLAASAIGRTSPNPMVGCVIVKDDQIVGEGCHVYAERAHAEVVALTQAGRAAAGGTAYITLEPCSTAGRTPPCVEALTRAHVKKVVACMKDPNPAHNGEGFGYLLMKGIILRWGLLKNEAEALNRAFIKVQTTGLPYVTVKVATSLDGKIATATGDSRGLSSPEAGYLVHQLRATVDAVVIGANTLTADNPALTTRWDEFAAHAIDIPPALIPYQAPTARTPVRVVVSGQLSFEPAKYRLFQSARESQVVVVTRRGAPKQALKTLEALGVQLVFAKSSRTGLEMQSVLQALAQTGFNHLLLEGGGELLAPVFEDTLWDELIVVQSPRLIGGRAAPGWFGGKGLKKVNQSPLLVPAGACTAGPDSVHRFTPAVPPLQPVAA